jgi:outer membrane receptor protein involved in Fe transport
MTGRTVFGSRSSVAAVATLALCLGGGPVRAGTTGKLTGTVLDAKRQPLAGANVALPEARTGAVSDAAGRFVVFNVPAGTYTVKVNLLGYTPTTLTGVSIPADRTTTLDVVLQEQAVQLQEVVVSAQRPVVELGLTSNVATVTRSEIEVLPVQDLQDIVNLQAGVVDGHFRGGREGEVQYQVDGLTVNNPFDNASSIRLDRSILEEVQVISGTFDAEYGQAMSGVVNAVLRRGTERPEWSGEVFFGDFSYPGGSRPVEDEALLGSLQSYQLTLSGPLGLPRTVFLASGRYWVRQSYVQGEGRFVMVDRSDPDTVVYSLAHQVSQPIGYSEDWYVVGKLTNRSIPKVEVSYQGILNWIGARPDNWDWRHNLDGLPHQRTYSVVHGLEWTQTLGERTFLRAAVRQNYFDFQDMVYDWVYDPRYDLVGPPIFVEGYEYNAILGGTSETRSIQNTNGMIFAGFVSHNFRDQQFKAGIEWQPSWVRFGTPGHLAWTGTQYVRHFDEPEAGFPPPLTFEPVIGSAYLQDDLEWNDLRFRAGLRFDYFNPKTMVPGDPANPANAIQGAAYVPAQPTTRKVSLSPRLGVSYPVTPKSSLFFAYGHFSQMPQLGQIFKNADYSVLATLQASSEKDYGVMGNPDVEPEKTIQYQFGYKQELRPWLGLDVTLFYKDIRDLLGTEIITTYNNAEYERLGNADFGSAMGFTVALDQRSMGIVSTALDYTWQQAKGNSSDPYETAARIDAKEDPRPRQVPLNWDQRHTLNLTVTAVRPGSFAMSGVFRAASGQPYTPESETGFGGTLETNSGRKPSAFLLDLRGETTLRPLGLGWRLFANVFNVFDTRYFNGAVFASTGSPYYSRTDTEADRKDLANPTRYYAPRRIELGVRWAGGSR